jgi:hypothetical protein
MSNIKQLKKLKFESNNPEINLPKSNYHRQFQKAVINLEHNLIDEKAPFLRKLA